MLDLTGFRFMRRVAHGRSRLFACREHHRRRLRKRNMGAPLHSHFSNDVALSGGSSFFMNWAGLFFLLRFFPFFFFLFFSFFFSFLERDCLLCAICDTWLRAWNSSPIWRDNGDVPSVCLSLSLSLSLSLCISLSLSLIVPHTQNRKRFRAFYNYLGNFQQRDKYLPDGKKSSHLLTAISALARGWRYRLHRRHAPALPLAMW